ncbi:transmembrane protein 143-like [Plakobranchus ocellatus]|uniref:Transmembrane protein 143-like n=1 Tax=Plakobranchus ocellatus TaxID=259542 RepID=A0AAV4DS35_9GAST|nr:transmembrane protein 143-like [Plakobranchus ocellatus]
MNISYQAYNKEYTGERYVPITRHSIIRHIIQQRDFLTDEEKKLFPDFALAIDTALINKYNTVLQELKVLFDPINPDKDTVKSREWTRREKLDNEFWLLQQLEDVMVKANFHEMPRDTIEQLLSEHESREGVQVSVDPSRYDVLRFWVLGHETPEIQISLFDKFKNRILQRSTQKTIEYYKRVVVAIRLKKDSKLALKAFKEVPVNRLEMLLPDGTIQMSTWDKGLLASSAGIALFGVLAKVVTVLASLNNIANNRGLITLLVDRAEDESLKEALLTYAFILNSRPAVLRNKPSSDFSQAILGGLSMPELNAEVEKWVKKKTGVHLEFDSSEALQLLKDLGLMYEKNDKYHALMLDAAMRILPQSPCSVIGRRAIDADIAEGYDRDEYLETDEEYKAEEEKQKKYGWF